MTKKTLNERLLILNIQVFGRINDKDKVITKAKEKEFKNIKMKCLLAAYAST